MVKAMVPNSRMSDPPDPDQLTWAEGVRPIQNLADVNLHTRDMPAMLCSDVPLERP
jgi:hypothetical protein